MERGKLMSRDSVLVTDRAGEERVLFILSSPPLYSLYGPGTDNAFVLK